MWWVGIYWRNKSCECLLISNHLVVERTENKVDACNRDIWVAVITLIREMHTSSCSRKKFATQMSWLQQACLLIHSYTIHWSWNMDTMPKVLGLIFGGRGNWLSIFVMSGGNGYWHTKIEKVEISNSGWMFIIVEVYKNNWYGIEFDGWNTLSINFLYPMLLYYDCCYSLIFVVLCCFDSLNCW